MAVASEIEAAHAPRDRAVIARQAHLWLALVLVGSCIASFAVGASDTSLGAAFSGLAAGEPLTKLERIVLLEIHLPRTMLGLLVGASLAVGGR